MRRPSSVLDVRPDMTATICPTHANAEAGIAWADTRGYSVTSQLCADCARIHTPFAAEWQAAKRERRAPVYA